MQPRHAELENLLRQLIGEHEALLRHLESQQSAMKSLDAQAMEQAGKQVESCRQRISAMEGRRKTLARQMAVALRLAGEPTLARLAEAMPEAKKTLMELRERLREAAGKVSTRATVANRVAGAVLGHLNTVLRLLAGAVEQAGLYTKNGAPRMSARIGVMEAVG